MLISLFMICAIASPSLIDRTFTRDIGAPPQKQVNESAPFRCTQSPADQSAMIRKAEARGYLIRRIEFIGNEQIHDRVLRMRVRLQEGDRFRRGNLVRSLTNLSRLKTIHPVRLSDVVLLLDDGDKLVDVLLCISEEHAPIKWPPPAPLE